MLLQGYCPCEWKVAEIIMTLKRGKNPNEPTSYIQSVISKLFETLFPKRLEPILLKRKLIPNHPFRFRNKHGTIDQIDRSKSITTSNIRDFDLHLSWT